MVKFYNKNVLIILLVIFSIGMCALIYMNVIELRVTNKSISEENSIGTELENKIDVLYSIKAKETEIANVLKSSEAKIPAKPDEFAIIDYFQSLSASSNLIKIGFGPRVEGEIATEMPITLNWNSDFFSLIKVLDDISTSKRFFNINNVEITYTGTKNVEYIINLSSYYKKAG